MLATGSDRRLRLLFEFFMAFYSGNIMTVRRQNRATRTLRLSLLGAVGM